MHNKKINIDKHILSETGKILLIGILTIICTFPNNDWTYSTGIDSPLSWVYNYIYEQGLDLGKHIIFPHGPLSFFINPLPENILISTIVLSVLKILLVFNLAKIVSSRNEHTKWAVILISAYIISILSGFNHLILANLILIYCNSYLSENRNLKYIAYALTAFAFYVKAYVAVLSLIISLSFIFYLLFTEKKIKDFLFNCLTLIILIVLFWILMYGTFNGLGKYLSGMIHLASDNSSAVSYYPQNNWLILSFFILTFPLLYFINRTKPFNFYTILIGFSLFAAWKHGMAREDYYHVKGFYIYFIICSIILFLFYNKNTYLNLALITTAFILISINFKHSVNYKATTLELFRVNNFFEFITDFDELKKKSKRASEENITSNKLPQSMIDSIGNSSVDVYPWDFSIIPANKFNWQPRIIINSYASYTSWLDKQNSNHFTSNKAPQYLIWELKKISADVNGSDFSSIDGRYLLNDEPVTILQILMNYEYCCSNNRFLVLKKRKKTAETSKKTLETNKIKWGEWVNTPNTSDEQLLRAKLNFNKSILQLLKSFFYKDEQFWIYLKLQNDEIHKFRIVPKNAADGLWINPYIFNSKKILSPKQIMFKASNEVILKEEIGLTWEIINFNTTNVIKNFFNIQQAVIDSTLFKSFQGFETVKKKYWDSLNSKFISNNSYAGKFSYILQPGMFSLSFSYPLDSIAKTDTRITADCQIKGKNYKYDNNIRLILSIDKGEDNIIWKGIPIDNQLTDKHKWNNILNFMDYSNTETGCFLNSYLWNTSKAEVLVDNFRIRIKTNR